MDGTGPMGAGKMTGRGFGLCGGGKKMGACGRGQGMRRGRCHSFVSPKNQLQVLEDEEIMLQNELEAVKAEKEALKGQK